MHKAHLINFAKEYGLNLTDSFLAKVLEYCSLLLEENKNTNLVSKNDEQKLLTRHVADSLIFAIYLNNNKLETTNKKWADIGSGAGFPVVPLCIYFKNAHFFAIEPRNKRCEFLNMAKEKLNLQNLQIIKGKAENCNLKELDFVSCRAVGSLQEDYLRAKNICKKNAHFLTLKSERIINELKNDSLLKRSQIFNYSLPQEETEYALVHILT